MNARAVELLLCLIAGLLALILFALVTWRERFEKSAYLQGRFNLDRATAWHLAGEK